MAPLMWLPRSVRRLWFPASPATVEAGKPPELIRAELFSVERLEQHAASLAGAQGVVHNALKRRSLAARLRENEKVLLRSYRAIVSAADDGLAITPAAEWLIDNYHLVEERIRQIRVDLPPHFYRQLPTLADGPLAGYPRVLGVAWAYVAHSDSHFDAETLRRFVHAYQRTSPLTIGELWAIAITLNIVLVENLRRASERIVGSRIDRHAADAIADRLLGLDGRGAEPEALQSHCAVNPQLSGVFVVQLLKRLRDHDPRVTPALSWLDSRLAAQGLSADDLVRDEHQRQGASNITVRNIITSMRLISDVNWPDLFETVSLVDEVLRGGSDFSRMDFATRTLYRQAIEELARGSDHSEIEVAHAAVEAAQAHVPSAAGDGQASDFRGGDPGYHLLAAGRAKLESALGYKPALRNAFRRLVVALGPRGYIACILITAAATWAAALQLVVAGGTPRAQLWMLGLVGIVPALDMAVALVNRATARLVGPTLMPGLALRDGVPDALRTLLVVPAMLTTAETIDLLVERLEVHYMASTSGEIYFALLFDWTDAATEHVAGEGALLDCASAGIARLNRLHAPGAAGARFHLLHRRRVWSDGERVWMGWERKRGKLHELNELLRGSTDTTFVMADGEARLPAGVCYVITLDADTRLPRDAARRMIGKLAHPLNRPRFDPGSGRVVEGYALLQPRVTPSLPVGCEGSLFQRVFSGMAGIDPYDAAASDVYQDLFGEGSYAGKGIYAVDAFEAALGGRVPSGSLLSHDLFEGTFARSAVASDIEVIEEYPSRYDAAAARAHRWARGDWQLLPWLLGRRDRARSRGGGVPLIGRWKMLDNLRRSVSAPAGLLALFVGWMLPWPASLWWTGMIVLSIATPALLPVLAAVIPRSRGVELRSHFRALRGDAGLACLQVALLLCFLPHQSWLMTDAIVRTLYRMAISRRHLLEWVTAAQIQQRTRPGLRAIYAHMGGGIALAMLFACGVALLALPGWPLAVPLVLLWLAAPAIARRISLSPAVAGRVALGAADRAALRLVARRTWRYFESFVGAADHHLPPDNFQEDPRPVTAHRTSPTNIGLYLLSTVCAHDLGWIGMEEALTRLEATIATLRSMQKFRGHLYNWYDTRDLRPLDPCYVSTVDSGNLAAHLIATANSCEQWARSDGAATADCIQRAEGVQDALQLTRGAVLALAAEPQTPRTLRLQLEAAMLELATGLRQLSMAGSVPLATGQLDELVVQAATLTDGAHALAVELGDVPDAGLVYWAEATDRAMNGWRGDLTLAGAAARAQGERLALLAGVARQLAFEMDFGFLFDTDSRLLSIGYRAADSTLDPGCYDLLASEARLASLFAIAKNDVPSRHWFRLGRAVTPLGNGAALVSWSGSMFEYLMPSLVIRAPAGSLLEQTNRLVVGRQISYGTSMGVPWGISESAFSARDLELTYQYSNFGVPGLGLKRGLGNDLVVAPYATALAAMVDPEAAARNFERLTTLGALGRYGFYESLDFTRARVPDDASVVVVRAFMAHHQGMTIAAITNVLLDGRLRTRFHAEPGIQATELLLQERTPRDIASALPLLQEAHSAARDGVGHVPDVRRLISPHSGAPQTHLLSNGSYSVMLTGAGSGYSRWRDMAITRWQQDATRDDSGSYMFLRDVEEGGIWSAGFQPSGAMADSYAVTFTEDRAEFVRSDGDIATTLSVVVSTEDDAEARQLTIANGGEHPRDIEVTSYCELALALPAADAAHPAFSKMFVQTEFIPRLGVLLATRRRRTRDEAEVWAAHHAVVEAEVLGKLEFETDRARFIGRGREIDAPTAMADGRRLSNTAGTVLDPVFALRYRVRIAPGARARLSFWTEVAATRAALLDQVDKHHDSNALVRATTLAWTQAQVQLRHLGIGADEANLFQRVAGLVLYASSSLRPLSSSIIRDAGPPSGLWAQGISGDLPLVLLRIDNIDDIDSVRQLLRAHEYWRLRQLSVDIVILNERASSYLQNLQESLEAAVRTSQSRPRAAGATGAVGSVYVLRADLISSTTRALLSAVARVVFVAQRGSLSEQLERRLETTQSAAIAPPARRPAPVVDAAAMTPATGRSELEFYNGTGGFAHDGREYVTRLAAGETTPLPWINVIANAKFGFQIASDGGGYTWAVNSREHQLTQWSNDPVCDRPAEVLYVRDEATGELWGPTLAPVHDAGGSYGARHGAGFSRFDHESHGIRLDMLAFVPVDDPIKVVRLNLRNLSSRRRRLSVTAYVEWVLGTLRAVSAPFIVTEMDAATGAMFARNPWHMTFGARVAFADLRGAQTQWTADRREFLGRHGRLDRPAAMVGQSPLSGSCGAGLDPCCALRCAVDLKPDEEFEVVFFLGEAESVSSARSLLLRYRDASLDQVFGEVKRHWDELLGTVQVKTPDRAMDIMLNGWLLYQTLACRIWARSAFYQASGAYGFRDQLQDGMALAIVRPAVAREHLLRAAGRQFPEGDVQHWWLPPSGAGVRTHISDDRIWLAYAGARYLQVSGDESLLDEMVAFIDGARLGSGEHDAYFQPVTAEASATFFEHCARGLDASLALGGHGLPLIGTGDWNDGMNRVGERGQGESVWLGWFLYATLTAFAPLATGRGEEVRAARWTAHAALLRESMEREGWDGRWYRRGFFDDGTPLGSAAAEECRIDSIAQSWSVMSGGAEPARAAQAMQSVDQLLLRRDARLALLFTPPFDHSAPDPGYVKGYPPGLRENGGQYTHAAAWCVIAYAELGLGDLAAEVFSMINPINHAGTRTALRRYKAEPYVVAADVYSAPAHVGRGGWTWYTGAAGWMYRAGLEYILGFRLEGRHLHLSPCIPRPWRRFEISFLHGSARYEISVVNPYGVNRGVASIEIDGVVESTDVTRLLLQDDGRTHRIVVAMGQADGRDARH